MRSPRTAEIHPPSRIDENLWREAESLIDGHRRFLVTTHGNPDGDGIGSEIALRHHLLARGKEVWVMNPDPVPPNLRFLDPEDEVECFREQDGGTELPPAEVVMLVDAPNWRRLGGLGNALGGLDLPVITIDHHPAGDTPAGHVRLADEAACATAELIYHLIARAGGPWSEEVARALYVAILTDTGSFRFANTSPGAHRMAAHFLDLGVMPRAVYERVHEQLSLAQLRLLGEMLASISIGEEGRIAWMEVSRGMLGRAGLRRADLEGFISYIGLLAGNEVGLQFVEVNQSEVRVSLRSKGTVNVGRVASSLGGGGHDHAAGALLRLSLEESRREVLAKCREAMEKATGGGIREGNDRGR